MKHLLPICCAAVLALVNPARAARSLPAPADTVAGHARMVQKLSTAMCTQLTNDHATDFAKMTPPAAMQFTQQLFVTAMQHDSSAFIAMMTTATEHGQTAQSVGEQVGKDVVLTLSRTCPVAMPLILRLSQTEQAQQAATAKIPAVTDVEKKALQPLATHFCTQLAAADAKQSFAKLAPAQRMALFTSLMQKEVTAGRPQLLRYYSAAQLNDGQKREEIGQKIAGLMIQQESCTQYLLLIGVDELNKQKP